MSFADMSSRPVAILAGGLATRLRPITRTIPKSMVMVAGKPFLEHQLEYLHRQGVRRVVLCVGYLGEMVEQHFGAGERFGIQLTYSFDGDKLLGTAGALKRALPYLGERFFVLYGDSWLPIPYAPVLEAFEKSGKSALMTVYRNENNWDRSNVEFENGRILAYDKRNANPRMRHIDYGLSLFDARAFSRVPAGEVKDLADLFAELLREGELAGCEVTERFYEIGSHAGLAELDCLLSTKAAVKVA